MSDYYPPRVLERGKRKRWWPLHATGRRLRQWLPRETTGHA